MSVVGLSSLLADVGCTQRFSFKWLNYSSRTLIKNLKTFSLPRLLLARQQVFRNSTDINNLNADRLKLDLETLEILFQRLLGQSLTAQLVRNMEAVNLIDHSNDPSVLPPAAGATVIENLICIECLSEGDLLVHLFFQHTVRDTGVARLPRGNLFHHRCVVE